MQVEAALVKTMPGTVAFSTYRRWITHYHMLANDIVFDDSMQALPLAVVVVLYILHNLEGENASSGAVQSAPRILWRPYYVTFPACKIISCGCRIPIRQSQLRWAVLPLDSLLIYSLVGLVAKHWFDREAVLSGQLNPAQSTAPKTFWTKHSDWSTDTSYPFIIV